MRPGPHPHRPHRSCQTATRVRASPGRDVRQRRSRGGCTHALAQARRRAGSRVRPQDGGGGDLLPAAGPERCDGPKLAPGRQMFRGADLADWREGHAHRPGNRCGAESARMGGARLGLRLSATIPRAPGPSNVPRSFTPQTHRRPLAPALARRPPRARRPGPWVGVAGNWRLSTVLMAVELCFCRSH